MVTNYYGQISLVNKLMQHEKIKKNAKIIFISSKLGQIAKIEKNNKEAGSKLRRYQEKAPEGNGPFLIQEELQNIVKQYENDIREGVKKKFWPTSVYCEDTKPLLASSSAGLLFPRQLRKMGSRSTSSSIVNASAADGPLVGFFSSSFTPKSAKSSE
jgi:hypothetical protein